MTTKNEVVDNLTTQGKGTSQEEAPPQTIIHPELAGTYGKLGPKSDMYDPIISTKVDGGAEGIISLDVPIRTTAAFDEFVAAEQRRQTVQAEAMVNLAVGLVLNQHGITSVTITPHDLAMFQQEYNVNHEVNSDGGFTIIVSEKEV